MRTMCEGGGIANGTSIEGVLVYQPAARAEGPL